MGKKKNRFRVVFTNGALQLNVIWGELRKSNLYFGFSKDAGDHFSYHESGQFHVIRDGKHARPTFFPRYQK
jgi:hypothetical protein